MLNVLSIVRSIHRVFVVFLFWPALRVLPHFVFRPALGWLVIQCYIYLIMILELCPMSKNKQLRTLNCVVNNRILATWYNSYKQLCVFNNKKTPFHPIALWKKCFEKIWCENVFDVKQKRLFTKRKPTRQMLLNIKF